jgi:uncharacterized membrane protein YphA (DoxX/SURF4 family)
VDHCFPSKSQLPGKPIRWADRFPLLLRIALGLLFIWSGAQKILLPHEFLVSVSAYEMLGPGLSLFVAAVLPWLELAIGILLVSGAFVAGALTITIALLAGFAGAVSIALYKGLSISCGCFTLASEPSPMSGWTLLRTLLVLAIAIGLFIRLPIFPTKHLLDAI